MFGGVVDNHRIGEQQPLECTEHHEQIGEGGGSASKQTVCGLGSVIVALRPARPHHMVADTIPRRTERDLAAAAANELFGRCLIPADPAAQPSIAPAPAFECIVQISEIATPGGGPSS